MTFQWEEVRDEHGNLVKLKAPLSNYKSVVIREWNHSPYVHIGDVSKCFTKNGGFDIKKSKSVSLNRADIEKFISMTGEIPSALDRIVTENGSTDSTDSDSSSQREPPRKKKQSKKLKKGNTGSERNRHVSSDSDETPRKKKNTKSKRAKKVHPYSRPKTQAEGVKRKRKDMESGSDSSSE